MELIGNGLNKGSYIFFYTPSQNAKRLLYYPIAAGDFYCNNSYRVSRTNYDSILAIFVLDGSISFAQENTEIKVEKNELLLIDCYKPHLYFTDTSAHTIWVHFDGSGSREWFNEIRLQKGNKIKCAENISVYLYNVIKFIKTNKNEYDISAELYSMFCELSKPDDTDGENKIANQIKEVTGYIENNYKEIISVEQMAKKAYMSASYFSKVFKETTSFSPYDYLLNVRLKKAKEMLLKTDLAVSEIAYQTGFNSTSNFIYFFKKETGISPLKFKNIMF